MTYLILAIAAFYFMQKSENTNEFLSNLNADDVLPILKLLGVNEQNLSAALAILPDLLSGELKPADFIKKAAPLIISLAAKKEKSEKEKEDNFEQLSEEFKPVEAFIPADVKNELSAFFE